MIRRLADREPLLARLYLAAAVVAVLEVCVILDPGAWGVAVVSMMGLAAFGFLGLLALVGLHIAVNPLWGRAETRGFVGIVMVVGPVFIGAALLLYPVAPREIAMFGNGAVTGWIGLVWAAHFLYRRHGLQQPVSPWTFWEGLRLLRPHGV